MPERPYRLRELHDHAVRSHRRPPDQERALRLHPDWPLCRAGCGWPVDPAAGPGPIHPGCDSHSARTRPSRVRVTGDLYHGRVPPGAIYIGRAAPGLRGSPWANRHPVGRPCRTCGTTHDRAAAVAAYRRDLARSPGLIARARRLLAGHDLACWCPPGEPCHGDVLLLVANTEEGAVA